MENEFEYTKGKALLTAVILTLGSIFIFSIGIYSSNHRIEIPAWDNFFIYVVPSLWALSFLSIKKIR